jgi:hypothetical protein
VEKIVAFQVKPDDLQALDRLAASFGGNRSAAIRAAIHAVNETTTHPEAIGTGRQKSLTGSDGAKRT